jgi:hypothetical protein
MIHFFLVVFLTCSARLLKEEADCRDVNTLREQSAGAYFVQTPESDETESESNKLICEAANSCSLCSASSPLEAMFRSLNDLYRKLYRHPIDSCVPRELIEELLVSHVVTAHARMCVRDF